MDPSHRRRSEMSRGAPTDEKVMTVVRRATSVLSCVALLAAGVLAWGQTDCKNVLFSGKLQGAKLGSWGSGIAEFDEEEAFLEGGAVRVETTGFFEGGRVDLSTPLAADQFFADPAGGYLRLVVKVNEPAAATPVAAPVTGQFPGAFPPDPGMFPGGPADPGMAPGFDPGMAPPVDPGMAPGFDPGMFPEGVPPGGMIPGGQVTGVAPPPPTKITQVRALIVADGGMVDSGPIALDRYPEVVEDWVEIVVPLSAFGDTSAMRGGQIRHIALFGDVKETFWVGDLTIGYEQQPLVADAGENIVTRVNRETEFKAAPQPEGVKATYVWDFDGLDGIQEEGFGPQTTWTFLTPGYYDVTLTVRDPDGRRVDRIDRVHVKVEE